MTQIVRSDVLYPVPLTNMSVANLQDTSEFKASLLAPYIPVNKQAGKYTKYASGYWRKAGARIRAPGTPPVMGGWHIDRGPHYYCEKMSFATKVPDEVAENADSPIDVDSDAVAYVTMNLQTTLEVQANQKFLGEGIWTGHTELVGGAMQPVDITPTISWLSDNSQPVNDWFLARTDVKKKTGRTMRTIAASWDVTERLKQHPNVIGRYLYSQGGVIDNNMLARLFDVDEWIVLGAIQNLAGDREAEDNVFMSEGKFLGCYVDRNPGIMKPTAMATFAWKTAEGVSAMGNRIKKVRDELSDAWVVVGDFFVDQQVISPDLGVLFVNVLY